MVPKQPTNQPTDRRAGHNQPTNKLRRVSENNRKLKKRFRFQLSPCEKQSCSLLCHCKAVRNTLTNTQVPQTSKTRPHARNNWGTWRGHNNQTRTTSRVAACGRGRADDFKSRSVWQACPRRLLRQTAGFLEQTESSWHVMEEGFQIKLLDSEKEIG